MIVTVLFDGRGKRLGYLRRHLPQKRNQGRMHNAYCPLHTSRLNEAHHFASPAEADESMPDLPAGMRFKHAERYDPDLKRRLDQAA